MTRHRVPVQALFSARFNIIRVAGLDMRTTVVDGHIFGW